MANQIKNNMRATLVRLVRPRRPERKMPPLLAPIPLYRKILRSHRKNLPQLQRELGDAYVKSEFHAHKDIDNPLHIVGFLSSWQQYLGMLEGGDWMKQAVLTQQDLNKMSEEQVAQLYELMKETQKVATNDVDATAAAEDVTDPDFPKK